MTEGWQRDLLSEKSLSEVFRKSKTFPINPVNRFIYGVVFICSIYVAWAWIYLFDINSSAKTTIEVSEICLSVSVSILGFLITGFAIFIGLSSDPIMVTLAKTNMPNRDVSIFKDIFFNFLSVFYIYLKALSLSIIIKVAPEVGLQKSLTPYNKTIVSYILISINSAFFILIVMNLTFAIVRLKSFIWNIYQTYITLIIARSKIQNG